MFKKSLFVTCLLGFYAVVNAKVLDDTWYLELGGGVGVTNYYYNNSGTSGMVRFDGGYNLNQYVNFQAGINEYFTTTINDPDLGTYNLSGYGYDLSILPTYGIGKNNTFNLFARLGIGYDNINSNVGNMSNFIDVEGLGARYDVSAHIGITAQWMGRGLIMTPSPSGYNQNIFMGNVGFFF